MESYFQGEYKAMLADEAIQLSPAEGASVVPPRRVLIVDDDPQQTEVLSYRLGRLGFRTLTAHCGHDGLRMARSARPQLILLDLRLPDADGLDVCQQLTDEPETCGIPVIILSGMERPDIIRRSRGAGCQYFVRKPYDPNALLVLVERALDR